jgi:lipopolysaccharide export system protein LptC
MKGELHIPDLPEVPVTLSPLAGPPEGVERRMRRRFRDRMREQVAAYIPLLLMIGLALTTWLIAKSTPGLLQPAAQEPPRHVPDYTIDRFTLQRFDPTGSLKVQIEGDSLVHYADDDTMEVERIRVLGNDPSGRTFRATALEGRATGDSSEIWLDGQAQVVSEMAGEVPVQMNGEHLRAFPKLRRVESDDPVIVQQGASEFHAEGMEYDQNTRLMTLHGTTHALIVPPPKGARFGKLPPTAAGPARPAPKPASTPGAVPKKPG